VDSGSESDRLIATLSEHGEASDGCRKIARLLNIGFKTHRWTFSLLMLFLYASIAKSYIPAFPPRPRSYRVV